MSSVQQQQQQQEQQQQQRRVAYITSKDYHSICDLHPKVKGRASLTNSLIEAYGLRKSLINVVPSVANRDHLLMFHTTEYVDCLQHIQDTMLQKLPNSSPGTAEDSMYEPDTDLDDTAESSQLTQHGFGYDCAVFSRVYDYCCAVTGGTLAAAKILAGKKADVVVNFNGGWHHAHVDEAAGFCYVNDIVIGILTLLKSFKRILYVDLDIHHGDGVEEAFKYSEKVMTLSMHNFADGFFPGTGGGEGFDKTCRKFLSTNIPLNNGVDDAMFADVFRDIFADVVDVFDPEVVVCQCGADGLTGDPLGGFNLTSRGIVRCIEEISSRNIPLMVLGGGGYNISNTARCWTEVLASLLGVQLSDDIPDHEHLDKYGPDYSLTISPGNRKNENSGEYVAGVLESLKKNLRLLKEPQESSTNQNEGESDVSTNQNAPGDVIGNIDIENAGTKISDENMDVGESLKRSLGVMDGNEDVVKKVCMDKTNI